MSQSHTFCSLCHRTFSTVRGLKIHTTKMHGSWPVLSSAGQSQQATSAVCETCNVNFCDLHALDVHKRTAHADTKCVQDAPELNINTGTSSTLQTVCDEPLNRRHDVSVKCPVCDKVCKNVVGLRMHKVKAHRVAITSTEVDVASDDVPPSSDASLQHQDTVTASVTTRSEAPSSQTSHTVTRCVHDGAESHINIGTSLSFVCDDVSASTSTIAQRVFDEPLNRTPNTRVNCPVCDKVCKNSVVLRMHQARSHPIPIASTSTAVDVPNYDLPSDSDASFQRQETVMASVTTRSKAPSSQNTAAQHDEQSPGQARKHFSPRLKTYISPSPRLKTSLKKKMNSKLKELREQFPCVYQQPASAVNESHRKLKQYHDRLLEQVDNTATLKLSREVENVVQDCSLIDNNIEPQEAASSRWTMDDRERLNGLNALAKTLPVPEEWRWAAKDDTQQGKFNKKRMEFCVERELEARIIHCPKCKSTGVLVGLDQVESEVCYDCLLLYQLGTTKKAEKVEECWKSVRPVSSSYPKRIETGHENEDLPELTPGERAVIAAVHPVVTVTKNFVANKKYRQENISLLQNSEQTWAKVLPRTDLSSRFMIIERRFKDLPNKYIIANTEKVEQWLGYLFEHHREYIRMKQTGQLELSSEAMNLLQSQTELATVVTDEQLGQDSSTDIERGISTDSEHGITQAAMESGLTKAEIFTFDKFPALYLNKQQILKIKQKGKIAIIEDTSERRQTYSTSANLCFPHLYPNGELSPLDFGDHKLASQLLKKQSLFAHKMSDGKFQWHFAQDAIHMMHQYAHLVEQRVHAVVGYYVSQHPDSVCMPIESVLHAFKDGPTAEGLLDSKLPDMTRFMSQIPNTRETWFSERLGIESISRDLGEPNVFITLNMDPRAWPDVRRLLYSLEYGEDAEMDRNWFEMDTGKFTELLDKHAVQVSIYLSRKVKIFLRAFLGDVCGIDTDEECSDWKVSDRTATSWYWTRVEFTETRGVQHWHCLAKLPNVLDTALLGRIIHNGRVVREQLKRSNIKPDRIEEAWTMVEVGLLANRYATLFAESISLASFFEENLDTDTYVSEQVIDVDQFRQEFVRNYIGKNVSVNTHPIMRTYCDPECDRNENMEAAKVAAVSCMHHCIQRVCGGDDKGAGCRFEFPKKTMKYTVPAIMQVNSDHMEAHMLLRRTCDRVPNLNRYFLKYWRANHDVTVLIDAAHKMRYATKYVAKTAKHSELIDEVVEHLTKRSQDLLPPSIKQTLSHLILADCSHRAFLSKHELAYKVMDLPQVRKTYNDVKVVGFYRRANLIENLANSQEIVYSDRTDYSAYAERCNDSTVCFGFEKSELNGMTMREFAETVTHTWKLEKKLEAQEIGPSLTRKVKTRDVHSGHWELRKLRQRRHIRWSTVIYSELACEYTTVEANNTTSQTLYYDLPANKRKQLYRAYQELVCYVPWKNSPEETFLDPDTRSQLEDKSQDPEAESRYSLQRLEAFHKKYMELWAAGTVAPPGSQWQRDNQYSYTMYLTTAHNRDIHLERVENKGIFTAQYEPTDEFCETDCSLELRPAIQAAGDNDDFPTTANYLPADTFSEILKQAPPTLSEVSVAFPLQHMWQRRQELLSGNKSSLFMADPPEPAVPRDSLSFWHRKAVDLMVNREQQILYIYGKAGTGKTEVALHICSQMRGSVQAGAGTGKAASNFNGPTVHAMFGWSQNESSDALVSNTSQQKVAQMRVFYERVDLFIIDEVNAMSAAQLALLDETMGKIFDPDRTEKDAHGAVKPFGGKMVLFMGDGAQLRPVCGDAIYDTSENKPVKNVGRKTYYSSMQTSRTLRGQQLYRKYLSTHCIWLRQGFRNHGLLQEIFDRVRDGTQTLDDLDKVMYQRRMFPDKQTDYGIHYSNESCSVSNWLDLWKDCKQQQPQQRMYVCRAGYHVTGSNDQIVSSLGSLKPADYAFAADIVCVAIGSEVRLIKNLNVAAGLVNSAVGQVVRVIYDNADVPSLLEGKLPAPYCIVVRFPGFRGFLTSPDSTERVFPFSDHHCVPLYREKFVPKSAKSVPSWIRKKQKISLCYREQFPIDLSRHITAHRAQGQTWKQKLLSVDLGLESPCNRIPPDAGSLIYVACTRVNNLRNLFVSAIFPTVWSEIGKSEVDRLRRESEVKLSKCAEEFAIALGSYDNYQEELSIAEASTHVDNSQEWADMLAAKDAPTSAVPLQSHLFDSDAKLSDESGPGWLQPTASERHIGIDQGLKNFAIVAVDKTSVALPRVVGAELYNLQATGLGCDRKLDVNDLVVALQENTMLMSWMQQDGYDQVLPRVERVIVHIEQISKKNKYNKQFEIELGRLLQRLTDVTRCVVKLSQPHVHRRTGPMFQLGKQIVEACNLLPVDYSKRTTSTFEAVPQRVNRKPQRQGELLQSVDASDVEPDCEQDCVQDSAGQQASSNVETTQYRMKKKMSSKIFNYFIKADSAQQLDMQVEVSAELQDDWKRKQETGQVKKFDDLGDALLHALNEILCGSSNYRALVPATPSLHVNRSIIITVLPTKVYWVVIQCTWNLFTLENFGVYSSQLDNNQSYKSNATVGFIKDAMAEPLKAAVINLHGCDVYSRVEQIRIIVKQLKAEQKLKMSRKAAGALTNATVEAMKAFCDEVASNGHLSIRNSKGEGWSYIRTLSTGEKFHLSRSTGKHTNAVISCLEWMKANAGTFVKSRPLYMTRHQKLAFFFALQTKAFSHSEGCHMEMVHISAHAASLFREDDLSDDETRTRLADLILIGLNKNGHYVSAVAGSYRK